MTEAERQIDYHEAVNDFLKLYAQELELQALKLGSFYSIDRHELLSRTALTVWKKWNGEFSELPSEECYKYTLRILCNHARNLSKSFRREWSRCEPCSDDESGKMAAPSVLWRDPAVEAIFRDERLAIYRAISRLKGRCRDVMVLVALGLEYAEIRQELGMTVSNLTSTLCRARKELRELLGGEPK